MTKDNISMVIPRAIARNLLVWQEKDKLAIKVIDDIKGYWAEDRLSKGDSTILGQCLYHFVTGNWKSQLYAVGKNLVVDIKQGEMLDVRRGVMHFRITDYRRNYWAETIIRKQHAESLFRIICDFLQIEVQNKSITDLFKEVVESLGEKTT